LCGRCPPAAQVPIVTDENYKNMNIGRDKNRVEIARKLDYSANRTEQKNNPGGGS
jgi:hypothetical protein